MDLSFDLAEALVVGLGGAVADVRWIGWILGKLERGGDIFVGKALIFEGLF
jgi:hypothetical protein